MQYSFVVCNIHETLGNATRSRSHPEPHQNQLLS
jgi:hypothetical protein